MFKVVMAALIPGVNCGARRYITSEVVRGARFQLHSAPGLTTVHRVIFDHKQM